MSGKITFNTCFLPRLEFETSVIRLNQFTLNLFNCWQTKEENQQTQKYNRGVKNLYYEEDDIITLSFPCFVVLVLKGTEHSNNEKLIGGLKNTALLNFYGFLN